MVQYSFNLLTEINEVGNIKQIVKLSAIGADDFSVKEGTPSLFNLHGFTSQ
jgi:hypothetical protein